jgi:hypothetical protein
MPLECRGQCFVYARAHSMQKLKHLKAPKETETALIVFESGCP